MIDHSQNLIAWLPIRSTAYDRHEKDTDLVDRGINAFISSLPSVLPTLVPELSQVKVRLERPPTEILRWLSKDSTLVESALFDIYAIEACVRFTDDKEHHSDDLDSFLTACSAHYIEKAISLSLHLGELAYPGAIMTSKGGVIHNGKVHAHIEAKYFLSCARPYDSDWLTWPEVQTIEFSDVVAWATSIGFPKSSFATSRLQRALGAFTHVIGLGWSNEGETLFRAMQGLEAFYCDGVGDLRRQLAHKCEIWLGMTGDKQNIVGKLYDLRSKFVHGASKIKYWHDLTDPWEEDKKAMEEFADGMDFSTRLLLATLQKAVLNRATDVTWSYACDVTHPPIK